MKLNWIKIKDLFKLDVLKLFYKYRNGIIPFYFLNVSWLVILIANPWGQGMFCTFGFKYVKLR